MSRANCYEQLKSPPAILVAFVLACSSSNTDTSTRALAVADPAEASTIVKASAAAGCAGFARALDLLGHTTIDGRLLIGLVDDALVAAKEHCPTRAAAIRGKTAAHQLARAKLVDGRAADALSLVSDRALDRIPAIRLRRAELLDRLGRPSDAIAELDAITLDDQAAATRRLYVVAAGARAARFVDVTRAITGAPITERTSLAFRAVADTPAQSLDALARAAETAELATAAADRIEQERGPAAALSARERAVTLAPELAEPHDALARAQIAAGKIDDALASWDRASTIAPAQTAYRVTPIRALAIANEPARARARANALAVAAREAGELEGLVAASAGAAAAGDPKLAVVLAREARALRPGDGRLGFLVAQRHAEANEHTTAADLYAELLVCGAHGRPWHRHEVSAKLVELADHPAIVAALGKRRACEPADAADLARYVTAIRGRLDQ